MWFEKLPFWDRIGPAFVMGQVLIVVGVLTCVIGWITGDESAIFAGLTAIAPGAFAWFLLWRTYADDGYMEDRYERRHERDY